MFLTCAGLLLSHCTLFMFSKFMLHLKCSCTKSLSIVFPSRQAVIMNLSLNKLWGHLPWYWVVLWLATCFPHVCMFCAVTWCRQNLSLVNQSSCLIPLLPVLLFLFLLFLLCFYLNAKVRLAESVDQAHRYFRPNKELFSQTTMSRQVLKTGFKLLVSVFIWIICLA